MFFKFAMIIIGLCAKSEAYSWFSPTWLLPWRRLLSAMLVPKQTRSIERSQWEWKPKSVLCVVLCCGSRSDWDKLIGLYQIPLVVFATRRIWGRTDHRAERKIKNKSDQSRRHGIERRLTANGYLASILFLESQLLADISTTKIGFPNKLAKLGHDANAERDERTKKRYELARGRTRTRARIEVAENIESLWKAVFLLLKSTSVSQLLRQKKREIETKGMRRPSLLISRP